MGETFPRVVLVASLSAIRGDGRILRQIDAVLDAGHSVVAFGAPGGAVHPAEASGTLRFVDVPVPGWSPLRKLAATAGFGLGGLLPANLSAPFAACYPGITALRRAMMADPAVRSGRPLFAIANDWHALPAVLAVHRAAGVAFHYDSHEFATEEHAHNAVWALVFPRLIRQIEGQGVRAAHSVSSPSAGICRALSQMYGPLERIAPVRNVGNLGSLPPRATGAAISVLYHGLFKADRGLDALMDDVAHWPAAFTLDLRGTAPTANYQALVARRADASGGRIRLHPMASLDDLLARTHASDIGVFLPDLGSRQLRFAMPNKVFEYLHAGLMLIVPEGCDMADFVRETGAGLAIDPVRQPLHTVLAGLSRQEIDGFKIAAHRASQHLTWANEARKLRELTGL